MAINKRKILQSAQKHLQKGAFDRALKDYKTLLEADPRDSNVRLKVGDILLKQGKGDEAVSAYLKVAQQFMKDGFDAKAVALYKQITKIDPKRLDVQVPLAELYQRLGLVRDAMAALQTAADGHYREGNKPAALEVLRKMATLDPTNTTNRLKVAELLRQEGMLDEALLEYRECAAELERQGELEGANGIHEKVLEVAPDDRETLLALGRSLSAQRRFSRAEEVARRLVDAHPGAAVEACEVLADAYRGLRRDDALPDVYRRMADGLRARGDENAAREILQRHVPSDEFALEAEEAVAPALDADADSAFEAGDDELVLEVGEGESEPELELDEDLEPAPAGAADTVIAFDPPPAAMPEASGPEDPAQLVAEASVFLRYGKQERALESLESAAAAGPAEPSVMVQLGECFEACGDKARAAEWLERAAAQTLADGDAATAEALRDRISALDPARVPAAEPSAAAATLVVDADGDIELGSSDPNLSGSVSDDEFDFGDDVFDVSSPQHQPLDTGEATVLAEGTTDDLPLESTAEPAAVSPSPAGGGVELDFDFGDDEAEPERELSSEPAVLPDDDEPDVESLAAEREMVVDELASSLSDPGLEVEIELGDDAQAEESPAVAAPVEAPPAALDAVVPDAGIEIEIDLDLDAEPAAAANDVEPTVRERLEEAAFYLQQGLFDEAEAGYRSLLETTPDHPDALGGLEQIAAARAPEPDPEPEPEVEPPTPAPRLVDDLAETTAPLDARDLEDADSTDPAGPVAAASEADEVGDFDLAKELSGAFHEREDGSTPAKGTEGEGFEEVFAAFKKGVDQQLGEDVEARFDLGIAYKEMGLLDDAMSEFRAALEGPGRKLECLHMMGLCALEAGQATHAVGHLEQALALPDVPAEQMIALRYDVARAHQASGAIVEARAALEAVVASDAEFRDAGERLAALDAPDAGTDIDVDADASSDFESFEDLMGAGEPDDDEPVATAEAESADEDDEPAYESFEDLMAAEAEAEEPALIEAVPFETPAGEDPPEAAAELPAPETAATESAVLETPGEEAPEPSSETEKPPGKRRGRRKKISFV